MAITRLAPHANSLDVNITINEQLRPYFTQWYQATKIDGDTPESFALRYLKEDAMKFFLQTAVKSDIDAVESAKQTAMDAITADVTTLRSEVE